MVKYGMKTMMPQRFQNAGNDLHRISPAVFVASLIVAALFTAALLTHSLPRRTTAARSLSVPPVIIHLQDIPETRQIIQTPAPAKPFVPSALPVAAETEPPDTVTIRETKLDIQSVPAAPPALLVPATGNKSFPSAAREESEIFEFFNVEVQPKRLNAVTPEFPEMANRAGIEGTVFLKVLVNAKGFVDSVIVQKGPAVFHTSAIAAARATTFIPAKQNDRAVPCWVVMPFRFVLKRN